MEPSDEQGLIERARELGLVARDHPLVQRLKRLEEIIREDAGLRELWDELEGAEASSGGCGSGGCSSGGCGTKQPGEGPPKRNGGPKPGEKMDLYARFSDQPVLQEYVQVRHRFYVLVDSMVAAMFEALYGRSWLGLPQVDPLGDEPEVPPRPVGFAGVSLVDPLPDDDEAEVARAGAS